MDKIIYIVVTGIFLYFLPLIAVNYYQPVITSQNDIERSEKVVIMAGVMRNYNGEWRWIEDPHNGSAGGHVTIGVSPTITSTTTYVEINFNPIGHRVVSLICNPDETYIQQRVLCGSRVSHDWARIFFADALTGNLIDPATLDEQWGNFWISGVMVIHE